MRVDAGARVGTGHVMRCLALSQAWQDAGGRVFFVMSEKTPALISRLQAEGLEVAHLSAPASSADDALKTTHLALQQGAAWVVVDGYHFGADYQRLIKESGLKFLAIDDYGHAAPYYADIVLNQNIYAHEGLYPKKEPYTRLLLGSRFVLLRREFLSWRGYRREIPAIARKLLITLGGGDFDNVTAKVLQALRLVEVGGLEVVVVVGEANPHYQGLHALAQNFPHPLSLASNVANMPELMVWADMAITGGGSTCWELAFLGLPDVTIILADNQRPVAEQLSRQGVVVNLGWHASLSAPQMAQSLQELLSSPGKLAEMAGRGQELIDGEGRVRVLEAMFKEAGNGF